MSKPISRSFMTKTIVQSHIENNRQYISLFSRGHRITLGPATARSVARQINRLLDGQGKKRS